MPSDPPNPAQWNLQGWMAAYHEAMRRGNPPPSSPNPTAPLPKEEPVSEMTGGWKFEGKEQPVTPKICVKCQGTRRTDQPTDEYDKSLWCESCLEGKPLGHPPTKPKAVKSTDRADINHSAFFGG